MKIAKSLENRTLPSVLHQPFRSQNKCCHYLHPFQVGAITCDSSWAPLGFHEPVVNHTPHLPMADVWAPGSLSIAAGPKWMMDAHLQLHELDQLILWGNVGRTVQPTVRVTTMDWLTYLLTDWLTDLQSNLTISNLVNSKSPLFRSQADSPSFDRHLVATRLFLNPAISNYFSCHVGLRNTRVRLYLLTSDWLWMSLTGWPTDWLAVLLTDLLTDFDHEWLTDWLTKWLTCWLGAYWLTNQVTDLLCFLDCHHTNSFQRKTRKSPPTLSPHLQATWPWLFVGISSRSAWEQGKDPRRGNRPAHGNPLPQTRQSSSKMRGNHPGTQNWSHSLRRAKQDGNQVPSITRNSFQMRACVLLVRK